jgi:hypothetical protein
MQYTIVKLDTFDSAVALFDRQPLHQVLCIPIILEGHFSPQHPTPHARASVPPTQRLFQPYSFTLLPTIYYLLPNPPHQHTHILHPPSSILFPAVAALAPIAIL